MNSKRYMTRRALPKRSVLVMALALGMGISGLAMGQSTTGTIFGTATSGETVVVRGVNGVSRTVQVGSSGRYSVGSLPVGQYTVSVQSNGQTVNQRSNVQISAGGGTEVDFGAASSSANAQELSGVQVSANALPAIDVTSVSSSTVITAADLQKMPVGRSAESIALLSPGVVSGSGYFGNVVSFGGAGVTENAYYVNGYNTTQPYRNLGGFTLPYGAIQQQQTFTGGYSAKYGRSDGGVLNQVGKRGTNEWHFGGQIAWTPRSLRAAPANNYFPLVKVPDGYKINDPSQPGTLYRYRNENKEWETIYSAYLGGPLIQDRLFIFMALEKTKHEGKSVPSVGHGYDEYYRNDEKKVYGKLDWNITDSNILELTYLNDTQNGIGTASEGTKYEWDDDTLTEGGFYNYNNYRKHVAKYYIAQYTGYLTDNATLQILYGQGKFQDPYFYPAIGSDLPYTSHPLDQNPAYLPPGVPYVVSRQTALYNYASDAELKNHGLRVDFTYQLGNHKLGVGIDNVYASGTAQGQSMSGPGYAWSYQHTTSPNTPVSEGLNVGAPGGDGYYVSQYIYAVQTHMTTKQKAWYVQDVWNVTDTFQLNLGVRNDHFINYNSNGVAFVDEDNQWEPRIGFSWDVNGDSSFKIYGNAGRYYLALPLNVAERAANGSTFTNEYFNYTGIDENGNPTGLTPIMGLDGTRPGPVSSNNEFGQAIDPNVVTATDLKAQYQDEYILGFDKTWGPDWVYGAKLTYRELKAAIDDVCDPGKLRDKIASTGANPDDYVWDDPGCRIFNPGQTNTFNITRVDGSGYDQFSMSSKDWGFLKGAKRKYYGLDLYLEHPFDGKWQGRIDYTFSRSWGNAEGQVRSDFGQQDVSKTEDWDSWQLMDGAYGYLANHRRHQLKIRGAYQFTPEWLVSGTLRIQSGTPAECLGYYGNNDSDPINYGPNYHYCYGKRVPPGTTGFTPWTHILNLGVHYKPAFADHKLTFAMDVYNVLDEQKGVQIDPISESDHYTVSNTYGQSIYFETPRYVRFSVSYDY